MPELRALLLDYDMTLVDSIFDFYEAFSEALALLGRGPIGFGEFYSLYLEDRLDELAPRGPGALSFWRAFRRAYKSRRSVLKPGAPYLLSLAKSIGVFTAVITGREIWKWEILQDLRRFGIDQLVDEVYTMADLESVGGCEQHPFDKSWLIAHVLEKLGAEPCEAVFVGDYRSDFESASAVGVRFVGVAEEGGRKKALAAAGAPLVVGNLYEVASVVFSSAIQGLPCSARYRRPRLACSP